MYQTLAPNKTNFIDIRRIPDEHRAVLNELIVADDEWQVADDVFFNEKKWEAARNKRWKAWDAAKDLGYINRQLGNFLADPNKRWITIFSASDHETRNNQTDQS